VAELDGDVRWLQEWRSEGVLDFRVGRAGSELGAEWANLCVVRFDRSGQGRSFAAAQGVDSARARRLMSAQIRGLVRHLEGRLSLHASAVARGGAAVALLGPSTSGKSTLAAELCVQGSEMLADDASFVDLEGGGAWVVPGEDSHWLREDAGAWFGTSERGGNKLRLAPPRVASGATRLVLIVGLVFDDGLEGPVLQEVDGHEAFRWLRTSLFRLVVDEPDVQADELRKLAEVHQAVRFLELRRPRGLEGLRDAGAKLLEVLVGARPESAG